MCRPKAPGSNHRHFGTTIADRRLMTFLGPGQSHPSVIGESGVRPFLRAAWVDNGLVRLLGSSNRQSVVATASTVATRMSLIGALLLGLAGGGASLVLGAERAGAATTTGDRIAAIAASEAGVPYCDGGGGIHGPSNGGVNESGCGPRVKGFDCMSLVQYAVYQATGIALPADGSQLKGVGTVIPKARTLAGDIAVLRPGDAVYWGGNGMDGFAHSGIYAGHGKVWDAVDVNQPVQTHTMAHLSKIYAYDGAIRYSKPKSS
jgi:cell wall-associated NlpC family hydrolase